VPREDKIADIVSRWRLSGRAMSRLVVPLYSAHRAHAALDAQVEVRLFTRMKDHTGTHSMPLKW
jgi:hypothetical protein